mmetsp:Transcript_29499/g.47687  ORF Transcript_29499/g.47687 Transcript_29499/m.47687 type:complete len:255 (+) Transcript_29499:624-1388(+)
MSQAAHHCIVHAVEEPLFTHEVGQASLTEGPVDAIAHHGEGNVNALRTEVQDQILQNVQGGGVDTYHRGHLQDDVLSAIDLRQGLDPFPQPVLDEVRVGKIYRTADARDEHIGNKSSTTLLLHVAVDGGSRQAPKDGDLRPHGLIDHDAQGKPHGKGNACQNSQEERSQEGCHPEEKVVLLDSPKLEGLLIGHQRCHRADHNGGQDKVRKEVEEGRQPLQGTQHHQRGHQSGQLRLGARGVVHGRAGETARHGV